MKPRSKIASIVSIAMILSGILPVFAEEYEIPQNGPINDEPISADCTMIEAGSLIGIDANDSISTAEIDADDVTISVEILDEYEIPGFSIQQDTESENMDQSEADEASSGTDNGQDTETIEDSGLDEASRSSEVVDELENHSESSLYYDAVTPRAAALPDLMVTNLKPRNYKETDTLPVLVEIPFDFQVGNVGTKASPNSVLEIFFNGVSKGKTTLPAITPGTGYNLQVGVGCKQPGSWEIRLEVNGSKSFQELDYGNNTYRKTFKWGKGSVPDTGLVMQSFYLKDGGEAVFEQGVKKTFLMDIANTSNTAASNVQVKFELETVGGTPVLTKTMTLDNSTIPAKEVLVRAGFELSIDRRGGYILRATVLPPSGYKDPDLTDNSAEIGLTVIYGSYGKTFCTHMRNGKFPDGTALDIYMDNSVTVVRPEQIATAASYWNGITNKISYKSLSTSSQKPITVFQTNGLIVNYPDALGVTFSNPGPDAAVYTGAKVELSSTNFDKILKYPRGQWTMEQTRTACVSHELGHVVGVLHSNLLNAEGQENHYQGCPYPSIMCSRTDNANYSAVVEEHDMYNLWYRYK